MTALATRLVSWWLAGDVDTPLFPDRATETEVRAFGVRTATALHAACDKAVKALGDTPDALKAAGQLAALWAWFKRRHIRIERYPHLVRRRRRRAAKRRAA